MLKLGYPLRFVHNRAVGVFQSVYQSKSLISQRFPAAIQNAQYGYHCSIGFLNQKAWIEVKIRAFHILHLYNILW